MHTIPQKSLNRFIMAFVDGTHRYRIETVSVKTKAQNESKQPIERIIFSFCPVFCFNYFHNLLIEIRKCVVLFLSYNSYWFGMVLNVQLPQIKHKHIQSKWSK